MPERKIDPKFNIHASYRTLNILNPYRFATGPGYEPETLNYLAAVGIADDATVYYSGTPQEITGSGIYTAVDTYVKALKSAGVFAKLKAVYPLIGGNADAHKWNLINPQDTDAAHRMVWYGAGIHSGTGFKGNGTNAYGDTMFNQALHSELNNESFGVYTRILNSGGHDFSVIVSGTGSAIQVYIGSGSLNIKSQDNTWCETNISKRGYNAVNRIQSTELKSYAQNVQSVINDSSGLANANFHLAGRGGGGGYYSDNEFAYAFIGQGLTETEMTAHYNAVQQLQTDLGRQV